MLKGLIEELTGNQVRVVILTDSSSSVSTVHNPVTTRYRFLAIYISYIQHLIQKNNFAVKFIPRECNLADVIAKQVGPSEFVQQWKNIRQPFRYVDSSPGSKEGAAKTD